MATATSKKSVSKKVKQLPAKKKTAKAPSKVTTKFAVKAKKADTSKKPGTAKKIGLPAPFVKKTAVKSVKKEVLKKVVVKKNVIKKTGKLKKPQEQIPLSKDRLPELKRSLIRKKEDILKEVKEEISKYISGENKQLVDTANDDGDWAQVDISEDLSLQRLSAHRKLMHDIDEAVRKIGEGTYGICEECGEEISEKRLLVLPTATLCVDCQEQKEQIEAIEGEE
jgi:DnaK suppressor protein